MDETFDVFLNGMENNCQQAEINELLRSRAEPPRVAPPPQKNQEFTAADSEFMSSTEEKTQDLVERAEVCTNEAENLEQEHKTGISSLQQFTQKSSTLKQEAVEVIEMSKNMYVCELDVSNIGASVFPEMIAKSQELNAEAKRRIQQAKNSFNMDAFTLELNKIAEQQQKKTDLIMERDAQMSLLEDLSRDVEARQVEVDDADAETDRLLAQLEELNAAISTQQIESENASTALAAGIQKMDELLKRVEQFDASEAERIVRETTAKSALEAATAENSVLEQQIAKAEAEQLQQTSQEEAQFAEVEQSIQKNRKAGEDELTSLKTQAETLSSELVNAQQELERISEVKKAAIEEQVAKEAFSAEIADVEQQIVTLREEMKKAENSLESTRLEMEAAVAAKTAEIDSAQKELSGKEYGLAVEGRHELQEKSLELRTTRDAMAKELKLLNMSAFSAEAKFRRDQRKALNKSKEEEKMQKKCKESKKATNGKSVKDMASGDYAETPTEKKQAPVEKKKPSVEKKQSPAEKKQPVPKNHPVEQAVVANADDSLYDGSDDDEEGDDDDMGFNLSFVSDKPTNTQSQSSSPVVPPPSKFADAPEVTDQSSITFDPTQCVTSTPIQKRGRGRAASQAPKKPQKLTATRRVKGKK